MNGESNRRGVQGVFHGGLQMHGNRKMMEELIRTSGRIESPQQVNLDVLVNLAKSVSDHRTDITGVSACDLEALKIDHRRVIDPFIFTYLVKPCYYIPSLNSLCKSILGYHIREEGVPLVCLDDPRGSMKLVGRVRAWI